MVRKTQEAPSQTRLKEVLDYNPATGQFTWRVKTGPRVKVGDLAGGHDFYGMWKISLDGAIYPAHYLAWLYVHNEWPSKVKHKNGKRDDNRIDNLFVLNRDEATGYKTNARIEVGRLRNLLDYDPETGVFLWKIATSSKNPVGSVAGVILNTGYRSITVDGRKYLAHRLAWYYVNGTWPPNEIDHINRDRADNRMANLRMANKSENMSNGNRRSDNKSGVTGVTWHEETQKWRATIQKNGKQFHLKLHDTIEEAAAAYAKAAKELHGEFARAECLKDDDDEGSP